MNAEPRHHHLRMLCEHSFLVRIGPVRILTVPQDIIALVVQGVGGSIISDSLAQNSPSQANHLANLVRCGAILRSLRLTHCAYMA